MHMHRDWVCVGDSTGKLYLLDLKKDSKPVKYFSIYHERLIGVHMTDGCLITTGSDRAFRISSLTDPPEIINGSCTMLGKITRVSITRIYRKKNDFDKIFEIK